ncbi:MAG: hypothetical protein ED559_00260 [Phycisphaera sp.]|nr:MAG: hypothetical protein ED559_00260 [Phycisphaera sp.]
MDDKPALISFLADRDAPCPGCMKNLRGQVGPACPVCRRQLFLGELRSLHLIHGNAKGPPMPPPEDAGPEALRRYLQSHDAECPDCGYQLRGLQADCCPECNRELGLLELDVPPGGEEFKPARFADFVMIFSVIPILFAALLVLYPIFGSAPFGVVVFSLMALLLFGMQAYLFMGPFHRAISRRPLWALLFNPLSSIVFIIVALWSLSMVYYTFL